MYKFIAIYRKKLKYLFTNWLNVLYIIYTNVNLLYIHNYIHLFVVCLFSLSLFLSCLPYLLALFLLSFSHL